MTFCQPLPVSEILDVLGADVRAMLGSEHRVAKAAVGLGEAKTENVLSFCSGHGVEAAKAIEASRAKVILCRTEVVPIVREDKTLIGVENPRLAFIQVASLRTDGRTNFASIAESARISASAKLGSSIHVGEFVVIGPNCVVGDHSRIEAGVVLYDNTQVGTACVIQAGAVVGAPGYGFERDKEGRLHRFPQLGNVVIEDRVEIGARACIDCGALSETRIGQGTKIDDAAYIAHNAQIGRDCLIMAQAVICGSARVGDRVEISPGAIVRDKVSIGGNARVGLGAVVIDDVAADSTVVGVPAHPLVRET